MVLVDTAGIRRQAMFDDQAEVYATAGGRLEAGYLNNDLDQVRSGEEITFGLRVVVGGRAGFASTNQPDDLEGLAERAVACTETFFGSKSGVKRKVNAPSLNV